MAVEPTEPRVSTPEEIDLGLPALFMKAFFYTRRVFDDAMSSYGVSSSQAGILNRIYEVAGISGVELSREMLMTPQAVQIMLANLEGKGLIERRQDPTNRRYVRAYITDSGREVIEQLRIIAVETEQKVSNGLSTGERRRLISLLERYIDQAARHPKGP